MNRYLNLVSNTLPTPLRRKYKMSLGDEPCWRWVWLEKYTGHDRCGGCEDCGEAIADRKLAVWKVQEIDPPFINEFWYWCGNDYDEDKALWCDE